MYLNSNYHFINDQSQHFRARLRCSSGSALVKINVNDKIHRNVKRFLKDFGKRRAEHSF